MRLEVGRRLAESLFDVVERAALVAGRLNRSVDLLDRPIDRRGRSAARCDGAGCVQTGRGRRRPQGRRTARAGPCSAIARNPAMAGARYRSPWRVLRSANSSASGGPSAAPEFRRGRIWRDSRRPRQALRQGAQEADLTWGRRNFGADAPDHRIGVEGLLALRRILLRRCLCKSSREYRLIAERPRRRISRPENTLENRGQALAWIKERGRRAAVLLDGAMAVWPAGLTCPHVKMAMPVMKPETAGRYETARSAGRMPPQAPARK